jgi:CheY-like chemotaxis protein
MKENKVILLAEDEENDVFMMRRAVRKMGEEIDLRVASDGEQAIAYLSGRNEFSNRDLHPLPDLILLDIKMPRRNGFDVLEWLKQDGTFTHIPVVMITSSKVKSDVDKADELGASAYLIKPVDFEELKCLITKTEEFLANRAVCR